jgi:hypothetical protein
VVVEQDKFGRVNVVRSIVLAKKGDQERGKILCFSPGARGCYSSCSKVGLQNEETRASAWGVGVGGGPRGQTAKSEREKILKDNISVGISVDRLGKMIEITVE